MRGHFIRFLACFLASFLLLSALPSCAPAEEAPPLASVNGATCRTAVLFSSLAELWLDAGGQVSITVGESVARGFASADTPLVDAGAGKTIHSELLLSLKPELVILSSDVPAQRELIPLLENAGIPVLALRVETFSDYLAAFRQMTALTGNESAYQTLAEAQKSKVDALLQSNSFSHLNEKSFLFVRTGTTPSSAKAKKSEEHFAASMLTQFGIGNIADSGVISGGLNMESILAEDPDYLFFSIMGNEEAVRANIASMLNTEPFLALTAVQEGRVYILPKELFHYKPNGRWWEAYEYLGDILKEGDA